MIRVRDLFCLIGCGFLLVQGSLVSLDLAAEEPPAPAPPLGPYEVIANKDLFDPERGMGRGESEDTTGPVTTSDEFKERYLVYGTVVVGALRQAYLKVVPERSNRPRTPRLARSNAGDSEIRTVTEGDLVDGYRVSSITGQGLDLEADGERIHLRVFDGSKTERKATRPVALQTPQPTPAEYAPAPGSAPAAPPAARQDKKIRPAKAPATTGSFRPPTELPEQPAIGGPPPAQETAKGPRTRPRRAPGALGVEQPAPLNQPNPLLELLRRSREQ